jgi:hypothetical protein
VLECWSLRRCHVRGGCAEALAGGLSYLACQSGEQCSIGFQPVSSVDGGWLPFLSGMTISAWLEEKNRSRMVVRYRLEAYATLRRWHVRGGCAEALARGLPYLAPQAGEQCSIGFQPVSSVDDGWLG